MNPRPLHLIALLALVFLVIMNSPAQAMPEQSALSGWVSVIRHTSPGKCIRPDRLLICRGRASVFQMETDDARLTGEASFVFDTVATKVPAMEQIIGEFHMDTLGGSWIGTLKGSTDPQGHTRFAAEGYGSGGYEGLVIRLNMERLNSIWQAPMHVSGTIDKGRSPQRRR